MQLQKKEKDGETKPRGYTGSMQDKKDRATDLLARGQVL